MPTTTSFYLKSRSTEQRSKDADKSNNTVTDRRGRSPSPSVSLGDECCGGFIDCDGLVEEGEAERRGEGDTASLAPTLVRTSGLRSASDGTP